MNRTLIPNLLLAILVSLGVSSDVMAQIRLESICTVHGQKEIRLTGMGIVVGLNGTGDGGKAGPTIRALAAAMKAMHTPVLDPRELTDAKNVAIVLVDAVIPATGAQKGQRLTCHVSSYLGAKSLRGGRLLVTPLQSADLRDNRLIGTAAGAVAIEDQTVSTKGRIPNGVIIETDLTKNLQYLSQLIDMSSGEPKIKLLISESHSSFIAARMITELINESPLVYEASDRATVEEIARAISPSEIEVKISKTHQAAPVEFIANLLDLKISSPHSISKVQINSKTGVVIVSGDVEISPVLINHPNLQINIAPNNPAFNGAQFKTLTGEQSVRTTSRLDELVSALNELGVPREAMIEVLRELARSGKLHARIEEI